MAPFARNHGLRSSDLADHAAPGLRKSVAAQEAKEKAKQAKKNKKKADKAKVNKTTAGKGKPPKRRRGFLA